jgi:hypothetical protein
MGMLFGGLESCMAGFLRDIADDLNQEAYQLDGEPQTFGQWLNSLWTDDESRSAEEAEDFDDWWQDLWD